MLLIPYAEAVDTMTKGLSRFMEEETARHFASVFADNSADGIASHGLNRFARYMDDMASGICNPKVLEAEKVSGLGGFEVWDAHFGVGPLIAEQMGKRVMTLAGEHGIGCIALRNNSHWLRAGRYALQMAQAGYVSFCFTNTCMNMAAWGSKQLSTGNNPMAMAVPYGEQGLLMDMAVSQYAFGKLEVMAQQGKMMDTPCGYDAQGNETNDPKKIIDGGMMFPMAMWKGSALSIMLDLMAVTLSAGRSSLEIGEPKDGEKGMSQVYIAIHPDALPDKEHVQEKLQATLRFFHSLNGGQSSVHAPGENLPQVRKRSMEQGIPVTEATWEKIVSIC